MKIIKKILARFGYIKVKPIVEEKFELENLDFIQKAVNLNKRMLVEEKRRSTLWSDKLLYEDLIGVIRKYFDGQNDTLKERVLELEGELRRERLDGRKKELTIQKMETELKEAELV